MRRRPPLPKPEEDSRPPYSTRTTNHRPRAQTPSTSSSEGGRGVGGTGPCIPSPGSAPGIEAGRWIVARRARAGPPVPPETQGPRFPSLPTCSGEPRAPAAAPLRLPPAPQKPPWLRLPRDPAPGPAPVARVIPGGGPVAPSVPALGAAPGAPGPGHWLGGASRPCPPASSGPGPSWGSSSPTQPLGPPRPLQPGPKRRKHTIMPG